MAEKGERPPEELNEPGLSPFLYPLETPGTPIRSGNKYVCPHCKVEVPVKQDCPGCGEKIDWSKI